MLLHDCFPENRPDLWNSEAYSLILVPEKCAFFSFNSIVKWVHPHAQCSVSLRFSFISILSLGPGWIKLCFWFAIPLSSNKGWNMHVSHLPEGNFLQCKNVRYLLWNRAFWFYSTMLKSCPIVEILCLTKIVAVLRSWNTILALLKSLLTLERQRLYLPCLVGIKFPYLY